MIICGCSPGGRRDAALRPDLSRSSRRRQSAVRSCSPRSRHRQVLRRCHVRSQARRESLKNAAERGGFQPLNLQRDGFFMSERAHCDRSRARPVQRTEGEPLFDEAQVPGSSLCAIQRVLGQIQSGASRREAFIRALSELKLIEPIDVSLSFDDGERSRSRGCTQ